MKKLVVSALGNRIYYANIKKDGTMGAKEDVTDEAIECVFVHLMNDIGKDDNDIAVKIKGYKGYVLKLMKE